MHGCRSTSSSLTSKLRDSTAVRLRRESDDLGTFAHEEENDILESSGTSHQLIEKTMSYRHYRLQTVISMAYLLGSLSK